MENFIPEYMKPLITMEIMNLPNRLEEMQRRQQEHERLMQETQIMYEIKKQQTDSIMQYMIYWQAHLKP